MRDKILIYRDYGCSDLNALEYGLKEYFEPRGGTVDFTDAAGIIKEGSLNESVLAFFMPGGAGTPFRRKLEVLGNEKIREYVRDGGIYYGICAGAYYACRETVFEEDIPELRIISSCGLNLVEGRAVGTLYKEFGIRPYAKDAASTAAVNLIWQDQEQHTVYYHGGPYFDLAANANPTFWRFMIRRKSFRPLSAKHTATDRLFCLACIMKTKAPFYKRPCTTSGLIPPRLCKLPPSSPPANLPDSACFIK